MFKFDFGSAKSGDIEDYINKFHKLNQIQKQAVVGSMTADNQSAFLKHAGYKKDDSGRIIAETAAINAHTEANLRNEASERSKNKAKAEGDIVEATGTVITTTDSGATSINTDENTKNAISEILKKEATEEANEEELEEIIVNGISTKVTKEQKEEILELVGAKQIEAGQNGVNTGSQVVEAGATDLLTAAKLKLSAAYTTLWGTMKPVLTAALPYLAMAAGVAAVVAIMNKLTVTYDEAHESMDEAQSKYDETTSSLESLKSEAQTTADRIKELEELKTSDSLSLVEENELNTLKAQNEELKTQIELKETLQKAQGKQLADAAKEAMDKGTHSVAQSVKMGDETGESTFRGEVKDTTDQQEVSDSIDLIKDYESKVEEINKSIADTEIKIAEEKNSFVKSSLERSLKKQQDELKHYELSIETLYSNLDTRAASIQGNLDALKLDPDVNEKEIKELEDILFSIATIDLNDFEKSSKQLSSYFDGSLTSSTLKQKIIEMLNDTENGSKDATTALSHLGLTLEDLGITGENGQEIFNEFFEPFISDAKEAKKQIEAVDGTLASIQSASESANDDETWNTVTDLFEKAKELNKQKKWGTDDFQSMAQFIAPEGKKLDVLKGDLGADDYKKLWDEYYKNFQKYFDSENPLKAAQNAQSKLISKGLGKKGSDGIIRWTKEFRSSADVADALGVSLEAAEVIMDNLENHGAEKSHL